MMIIIVVKFRIRVHFLGYIVSFSLKATIHMKLKLLTVLNLKTKFNSNPNEIYVQFVCSNQEQI